MRLPHFESEFDKIINRAHFSHEVKSMRKDAFSKFLDTGLPTQKWEDWRFTNLSYLKNESFRISESQDTPNSIPDISPYKVNDVDKPIEDNKNLSVNDTINQDNNDTINQDNKVKN